MELQFEGPLIANVKWTFLCHGFSCFLTASFFKTDTCIYGTPSLSYMIIFFYIKTINNYTQIKHEDMDI